MVLAVVCCVLSVSACKVDAPLTPAPDPGSGSTAAPDGWATLKVGAPSLVSPINSEIIATQKPTLTIATVTGQFSNANFQYEFELQTDAGTVVARETVTGTTFAVPENLGINAAFRWRARATLNGGVGPSSALGRFQTPRLTAPTATSSNDAWRVWFFALIDFRGVGPIMGDAAGAARPRSGSQGRERHPGNQLGRSTPRAAVPCPIPRPTGSPARVNLGDFGGPWKWLLRGATTCEGGSCK